jgi:hypothetical protein
MPLSFDLPAAADENLAVHATAVTARVAGAYVSVEQDLVLADSGLACDTFNFVCRARLTPSTAARRAAQAVSHFRAAGRPFSWWLGPGYSPDSLSQILRDQGLFEAESEVAMALDLTELQSSPPDVEGLTIHRVCCNITLLPRQCCCTRPLRSGSTSDASRARRSQQRTRPSAAAWSGCITLPRVLHFDARGSDLP